MPLAKVFDPNEYVRTYVCVPKLVYENLKNIEEKVENHIEDPPFDDSSKDILYQNTRRVNQGLAQLRGEKEGMAGNEEEEEEEEEQEDGKRALKRPISQMTQRKSQDQLKAIFYEKLDTVGTVKTKTSLKILADRLLSDPSLLLKLKGVKAGPYYFSNINFFDLLVSSVSGRKVSYLKNEKKYIDYLVRAKIPTSLVVNRFMRNKVEERRSSGDKDVILATDDDDDDDNDDDDEDEDDDDENNEDNSSIHSGQHENTRNVGSFSPRSVIDRVSQSVPISWFSSISQANKVARKNSTSLPTQPVFTRSHDDDDDDDIENDHILDVPSIREMISHPSEKRGKEEEEKEKEKEKEESKHQYNTRRKR